VFELAQQIWNAIVEWFGEIVEAETPRRARLVGRAIGGLLFELFLTKGLGSVAISAACPVLDGIEQARRAASTEAVRILNRATTSVRETTEIFARQARRSVTVALRSLGGRVVPAVRILRQARRFREATAIIAGQLYTGTERCSMIAL
jgi:hypothetical protein